VDAKVQANLAKLSPADRRLAEAQKFCPILENSRLGSMGPPFKLVLQDKVVFLCCPGCEDEARQNADRTLARVEQLKAKAP
jgi:hypothetical protein